MAEEEVGMNTPVARRIWLTGASSGIGLALAKELLDAGHRLALTARTLEPLQKLADSHPLQVLLVTGDITDSSQVKAMAERIAQEWGALDTAIFNAGTCEYIDARHFEAAMVERVVRTNLLASSYCIEEALPLLRNGNQPHLVGVASAVTFLALPRAEAYGASKAGLRYLYEALRIDLASENIDVTIVSPGFVDTPLTQKNDFPMPMRWPVEKAARYIADNLSRTRRPLEVSFPAVFILAMRPSANAWRAARQAIRTLHENRSHWQRYLRVDQRLPAQSLSRSDGFRIVRLDRRAHPHRGCSGRRASLCCRYRLHRLQRLDLPEFHSPAGSVGRRFQTR
ncbi:Short-chain dehydrogenase/reductase SDR [Pseudomonas coronafaciens pv. oryzae]|nr:Short-chain dehydrogenase/reductase SDR [Pseudomonas coronafaciens pv. oryzae]